MSEYTQGIMGDGAAILRDGVPMTPEEIVRRMTGLEAMKCGKRLKRQVMISRELLAGATLLSIAVREERSPTWVQQKWHEFRREANKHLVNDYDRMYDGIRDARKHQEYWTDRLDRYAELMDI